MACTAKWSSMTLSLITPVGVADMAGKKDATGTSFLPGGANDGGRWYPAPPCALFLKNESHD